MRTVAAVIASQVDSGDGYVLELGAGTGVIMHALLERSVHLTRLIVVERSGRFAGHLRSRVPQVVVVHGDAARVTDLLPPEAGVDSIVSSLPLRSWPRHEASTIVD